MMHKIVELAENALAVTEDNTMRSRAQLTIANDEIQKTNEALDTIEDNKQRLVDSADTLMAASTEMHAISARLTFERARLKRSSKHMRQNLSNLRQAQDDLQTRVEKSHEILEFAADTSEMIEAIEEATRLGQPIDHLLEAATALANTHKKTE